MCKPILSVTVAAALAVAASASQAMPVSGGVDRGPSPQITLVAGGCGLGWHRGPYGGCRPNRGPYWRGPYWRGPGWRFYGGCWRGPYGRVHCG
ncbi:MAG: hypothetical protein WAM55_10020 [Methylovirgula sp.]|jgi:hypothetical protein